jgi:hypothetical protein
MSIDSLLVVHRESGKRCYPTILGKDIYKRRSIPQPDCSCIPYFGKNGAFSTEQQLEKEQSALGNDTIIVQDFGNGSKLNENGP